MIRHVSRSRSLLLVGVGVLMLASAPVRANPAGEYGRGTALVVGNLIYGPTKLLYATGGGLVASFAYLFSGGDVEVARPIVDAALRGDYVITPNHLRGREKLEFIGRSPAQRRAAAAADWGGSDEEAAEEGF